MENQQHKHHCKHKKHNQQTDPGKKYNETRNRIYVNKCIVDTINYDDSKQMYDTLNRNERIFDNKSVVDNVCCEQHNSEPAVSGPSNKIYVNGSFFRNLFDDGNQSDGQVYYDKVYVNTSFFKNLGCCVDGSDDDDNSSDPVENITVICVPDKDGTSKTGTKKQDKKSNKDEQLDLHQKHMDLFLQKVIENEAAKNEKACNGAGPSTAPNPPNEAKSSNANPPNKNLDKPVVTQPVIFKQELVNCVCQDIDNKGHQHSHHHVQPSDNYHQSQCEQTLPKHSAHVSSPKEGNYQELAQCQQQMYSTPFKFPRSVESQMKFYYDLITDPRYQICTKNRKCDGGIESTPSICRCDTPPTPPISEPLCSCDEIAEYESSRKSRKSSLARHVCTIV